jgi:hypothetical protein
MVSKPRCSGDALGVLNFKGSLKKKHTPIEFPVIEVYLE